MRVPQVSERIKEAPAQALRGVFAGIGQLLLITDKLRNKAPAGQDVSRARTSGASGTVTATTAARPAGQREEAAAAPATPAATEPVTSATAPAATAAADEAAAAKSVAAESVAAKSAAARRAPAKPTTTKPATKPTGKPTTARRSPARPATAQTAPAEPAAGEPPKPPKRQSTRDFDKTGNVRLLSEEDSSPLSAAASAIQAEPVTTPEPVTATEPEPVTATEPEAVTATEPEAVTATEPEAVSGAEPVSGPADSAPPLPNYDELSVASLRARLRNLDVAQVAQLADYERAHAARADVLAMFERRIAKLEAEA
jgi:hypothetical protein